MPNRCCVPKCQNTRALGFHLFRLPWTRPDILKLWVNAIGNEFKPMKHHVICSAHFVPTDYMERPGATDNLIRLKNLAVPSIFFNDAASTPTNVAVSSKFDTASASRYVTLIKFETPSVPANVAAPSIGLNTTSAPTSDAIIPRKTWRSTLNEETDNSKTCTSGSLTSKMIVRKRGIMNSLHVSVQKQEMTPREKKMWRTIKSLKQKLRRKEEKISSLKNLVKILRYYNRS